MAAARSRFCCPTLPSVPPSTPINGSEISTQETLQHVARTLENFADRTGMISALRGAVAEHCKNYLATGSVRISADLRPTSIVLQSVASLIQSQNFGGYVATKETADHTDDLTSFYNILIYMATGNKVQGEGVAQSTRQCDSYAEDNEEITITVVDPDERIHWTNMTPPSSVDNLHSLMDPQAYRFEPITQELVQTLFCILHNRLEKRALEAKKDPKKRKERTEEAKKNYDRFLRALDKAVEALEGIADSEEGVWDSE